MCVRWKGWHVFYRTNGIIVPWRINSPIKITNAIYMHQPEANRDKYFSSKWHTGYTLQSNKHTPEIYSIQQATRVLDVHSYSPTVLRICLYHLCICDMVYSLKKTSQSVTKFFIVFFLFPFCQHQNTIPKTFQLDIDIYIWYTLDHVNRGIYFSWKLYRRVKGVGIICL